MMSQSSLTGTSSRAMLLDELSQHVMPDFVACIIFKVYS